MAAEKRSYVVRVADAHYSVLVEASNASEAVFNAGRLEPKLRSRKLIPRLASEADLEFFRQYGQRPGLVAKRRRVNDAPAAGSLF